MSGRYLVKRTGEPRVVFWPLSSQDFQTPTQHTYSLGARQVEGASQCLLTVISELLFVGPKNGSSLRRRRPAAPRQPGPRSNMTEEIYHGQQRVYDFTMFGSGNRPLSRDTGNFVRAILNPYMFIPPMVLCRPFQKHACLTGVRQ